MKRISAFILTLAVPVLFCSCDRDCNPAQYSRPEVTAVINGISATSLFWECDGLDAKTIELDGEGLTPETVTAASNAEESAFHINCNGDLIRVSPKTQNIDRNNSIEEILAISLDGEEKYRVALTQKRMDKPMILSLTPDKLEWNGDETGPKTIEVSGINLDVPLVLTSSAANSAFDFAYENHVITVAPKEVNEDTESAKEEVITVSAERGNSLSFSVRQRKAAKQETVLFETAFDVDGTGTAVSFNATAKTSTIDGKDWKMTFACLTGTYAIAGKSSHILASVRANTTGPAIVESSGLVPAGSTVTSLTVALARRNVNNGMCRVEYSADGVNWIPAGEDFSAIQSSSAAQDYTFPLNVEADDFRVRITFCFDGSVQTAHSFLNVEGIKVIGY